MKTDALQRQVFALVCRQVWYLSRPVLTLATRLVHDLELDSLERVQLSIRLEYDLRIEIPDSEIRQWHTLADVLACVRRCRPTTTGGPASLPLHYPQPS